MAAKETMPLPDILFKYRPLGQTKDDLARLEQIIAGRQIWWSSPRQFNDPFDCATPMAFPRGDDLKRVARRLIRENNPLVPRHERRIMVKQIERSLNEKFEDDFTSDMQDMMAESSIYSLALKPDNLLMWSHYGNSHQGVCLGFNVDKLLDSFQLIGRVLYSEERPVVRVGLEEPEELLKKMTLTKSSEWKYEQEWRLIGYKEPSRLRDIPQDCLNIVILGANISQDNSAHIAHLINQSDHPIAMYSAERDKRFFRINLRPVNEVAAKAEASG
jgi:hypothetical protein